MVMLSSWQWLVAIAAAVPCFLMAHRLWRVWRDPESVEGGRWVEYGISILVMEFVLIHSGAVMGGMAGSPSTVVTVLSMAGLIAFYSLFAAAIAYGMKSPGLFRSFLLIMLGRMVTIVWATGSEVSGYLLAQSMVSVVLYLFVAVLSLLPLPAFGMANPKYARALRKDGGRGLWVEKPHRAIGAATIYFLLLGLAQVYFFGSLAVGA